uniref:CTP synthase (glutamine hydrolyzing) n=1 Tax=Echinostoma caproni TaxID=27848 RepID=A0A183AP40_9TREM
LLTQLICVHFCCVYAPVNGVNTCFGRCIISFSHVIPPTILFYSFPHPRRGNILFKFQALQHAAIYTNRKLEVAFVYAENLEDHMRTTNPDLFHQAWLSVSSCHAVVVPGGFGARGFEGKLAAIRFCRERGIPFLGLCLGLQCAAIEFARNVLGWQDANSTEFDKNSTHPVVIDMPEFNPGQMGGTMRLGRRRTAFYFVVHRLINAPFYDARHRHRYEINPELVDQLEAAGLIVVGRDADVGNRMEIIELMRPLPLTDGVQVWKPDIDSPDKAITGQKQSGPVRHPYFVATQFHPEYTSRPVHPSPFFVGLMLAACGQLDTYLQKPIRLSPTQLLEESGSGSSHKMENFSRLRLKRNARTPLFLAFSHISQCL